MQDLGKRKGVLVVEDDAAVRDILCEIVSDLGLVPVPAAHGKEAIARLEQGELPAVILLDLMMPVLDGWKFRAWQLEHEDFASLPTYVLSAVNDLGRVAEGLRATGWLKKPVELDDLVQVLERHT